MIPASLERARTLGGRGVTALRYRARHRHGLRRRSFQVGSGIMRVRRLDPADVVLVAGTGRSGTTWLGDVLGSGPGVGRLFEPLASVRVPAVAQAGLDEPALAGLTLTEDQIPVVAAALRGELLTPWTTSGERLSDGVRLGEVLRARRLVVKEIRINRLLPFLHRRLGLHRTVLLVRHPCAVVASQLAFSGPDPSRSPFVRSATVDNVLPPQIRQRFPHLERLASEWTAVEELLAARWAIDQLVPLADPPPGMVVVAYEAVRLDPGGVLTPLYDRFDLPMPAELVERVGRPSPTTRADVADALDRWRTTLEPDRIARILAVVDSCGLEVAETARGVALSVR
ncbi:MAG: sulfotransferase [Acidimicrobiales bacterium]|nr:sulfotransferase [Acidimicrobiales bacterium]